MGAQILPPDKRRNAKGTLSRTRWLVAALGVLQREGIGGVRVERLARELAVTKGSFYWHFKDRADLLTSMLEYWDQQSTRIVTDNPAMQHSDPKKRLRRLMEMIHRNKLARYELAIRAWADHDPAVARVRRRVVKERYEFVRGLFAQMGFREDELDMRTRLFVAYEAWHETVPDDGSNAKPMRLLKLRHRLLTSL